MNDHYRLELLWNDIPIGKENAITYEELMKLWGFAERHVRSILCDLSAFDNGDDYVLIRSSRNKGFYRTDDQAEIAAYKQECISKGKSFFAPVKKINRVLNAEKEQYHMENNLRVIRELKQMKQSYVCDKLQQYDKAIDKYMLSKMENSVCLPTPYQLQALARIYECDPKDLVNTDLYY